MMRSIGVTGGVGCGKSVILNYISEHYDARIIYADRLAYELESPGHDCYDRIVSLLGDDILDPEGYIDKHIMADRIFGDPVLLTEVNGIIHPAVKEYICAEIERQREAGHPEFFVLEAALLIEEKYYDILDELWYVRTDADIRRQRLKANRGYSDEKTDSIMAAQLDDATYMKYCKYVIDNNGDPEAAFSQVDLILMRK